MARVKLGSIDYEQRFGAKLQAKIIEMQLRQDNVAKCMGVTDRTLRSRYRNPGKMQLKELKGYIKATKLEKEAVLAYLYEEDTH